MLRRGNEPSGKNSVPLRRKSRSLLRTPTYFLIHMKNVFFFFFLKKKTNETLLLESEGGGTASSSCTRCRRVHCLTTENVFHMNSEKTATSQSCYSVSLSSFFFDLYRLYSVVYFIVVFFSLYSQSPRHSFRTFYLTVKFDISATIMSETGVRWIWSAQSICRWTVNHSKHLDYYCCCFLTWNPSKSLHTTFPFA